MWETWLQSLALEVPLERETATRLQYSGLENPRDWYSPWGRKESDTTEQLSFFKLNIIFLQIFTYYSQTSYLKAM